MREYAAGGIDKLKEVNFNRPESELMEHRETLEAEFRKSPPATVAEAMNRIEILTGIKRSPTQVRIFLKRVGLKCRKVGVVPAKANVKAQDEFKKKN